MLPFVRPAAVALAALAVVACEDLGVGKAQNLPLEVARTQPPKPLVEQTLRVSPEPPATTIERPVQVAGQWWQATATEYTVPRETVQPVASAAGTVFYALGWDAPPYDRLLVQQQPGTWREFLEVR